MTDRLYGQPGAEEMYRSAEDVYECEDLAPGNVIEEWSVHQPRRDAPSVDTILSWITDHISDYGEVDESATTWWDEAAEHPAVIAAFDAALNVMASKVAYRMADTHLRDLVVTYGTDGTTLVDGEPLYYGEWT